MVKFSEIDLTKVKTLTKAILIILGAGAVLTGALLAPNCIQILQPFLRRGGRSNYERERIRQATRMLAKRKFVEYEEKGGKSYVRITKDGKAYIRQYELDAMLFPKGKWDSKWRVILFDIPETYGKARRAFQQRLKLLGCFMLQRSVLVYPYECEDEIDFITSFYGIERFVYLMRTSDLGRGEMRARRFFGFL